MYRDSHGNEMDDQCYWEALYNGECNLDDYEELPTTLIGQLEVLVEDLQSLIAYLSEQLRDGDFAEDPSERDQIIDQLVALQRIH